MQRQALNPFLPLYEYIPDGEPRVFGDRLYLYGSHDLAGSERFCEGDYVVWSAPVADLSDWRCEGVSYSHEASGASDMAAGNMAAPDCVQGRDGRYYLFYNRGARNACEVAVSDQPQGPFTYYGNVIFPDGSEPKAKLFDPGVLVDDDGSVYLYTGFVPTPESPWVHIAGRYSLVFALEPDMRTIRTGPVELLPGHLAAKHTEFEGHAFYEASSPRKINGRYYLVYSSDLSHELCYAVSDSPMGGFRYGGTLVSNADIGFQGNRQPKAPFGNTHGGLVRIRGQWYIFYHRQTHGIECCRQACAEPIELDEAGQFHQAGITSCGLNHGPLLGIGTYNAAYACYLTHESIGKERLSIRKCVRAQQPHIFEEQMDEDESHALHYIANMQDGATAGFKFFSLGQATKIGITISALAEGRMRVYLDEACTHLAASIPFTAADGWRTFSAPFHAPQGVFPLFFRLESGKSADWMDFTLL